MSPFKLPTPPRISDTGGVFIVTLQYALVVLL